MSDVQVAERGGGEQETGTGSDSVCHCLKYNEKLCEFPVVCTIFRAHFRNHFHISTKATFLGAAQTRTHKKKLRRFGKRKGRSLTDTSLRMFARSLLWLRRKPKTQSKQLAKEQGLRHRDKRPPQRTHSRGCVCHLAVALHSIWGKTFGRRHKSESSRFHRAGECVCVCAESINTSEARLITNSNQQRSCSRTFHCKPQWEPPSTRPEGNNGI